MAGGRHETLVALRVSDQDGYDRYRAAMTPLLEAVGGFFRADFRVSEALVADDPGTNRVFVISFPDEAVKDAFFSDAEYGRIKARHFEGSVASVSILGSWVNAS